MRNEGTLNEVSFDSDIQAEGKEAVENIAIILGADVRLPRALDSQPSGREHGLT